VFQASSTPLVLLLAENEFTFTLVGPSIATETLAVLLVVAGSGVAELTITELTAREYGVLAVVVTVMVALELAANEVNVHVSTPAA